MLLVTAACGLLILIEPDMGTAVTLCAIAFAMLSWPAPGCGTSGR